jgi:hypothetical protein
MPLPQGISVQFAEAANRQYQIGKSEFAAAKRQTPAKLFSRQVFD